MNEPEAIEPEVNEPVVVEPEMNEPEENETESIEPDTDAEIMETPAAEETPESDALNAPAEEPVETETTEIENTETENTEDVAGDEEETGSEFKYICEDEEHEHTEECYPQDDAAAEDEMVWDVPGELTTFFEALSDKASATAEILDFAEGVADALAGAVLKITELAVDDIRELFVNYVGEEIQNYAVFDLGFYLDDESEVEPGTEVAVTVDLTAYLADQDYDPASLVLYHHKEDEWGGVANVVKVASYEDGRITVDEETGAVTAMFTVNSFSSFTVTWEN